MKKGFSYLEVLVVVVLFAIGVVALGAARVRTMEAELSVRIEKKAINDLEDFMEWIKSIDYDLITSGDSTFGTTRMTWTVNPDTAGLRAKSLSVIYSWRNRSGQTVYDTIQTYVAER
ncbi:prepilin-type N-terminal cleavage/methylation domain-containing protein [candidate division WOR-3 bacterium]|nr:prepilin-type N-terminal cleavage/methylation domain-containing protein [candidate division WOR-3 bacterium]